MNKYLFAVDFGNRGSEYYEIIASTEKIWREEVWQHLGEKQDVVESMEMIALVENMSSPMRLWEIKPLRVEEKDVELRIGRNNQWQ